MSHSVALILHPKFPKDKDEGDNSSKEAALRINNLLQKEREFKFGSLCFKIVQTWTSATENECTGHAVWQGAEALSRFLVDDGCYNSLKQHGLGSQPTTVLARLRSRCVIQNGLNFDMFNVSQACLPSLLCATSRSFQNFYFTDRYGSVLKQAKLNVAENMRKHMDHPEELECRFMKLEWGKKLPSIVKVVDLVLGADVVYFPESHDLLITTLKALFFIAKANVVLLCHPERGESHTRFCRKLEQNSDLQYILLDDYYSKLQEPGEKLMHFVLIKARE